MNKPLSINKSLSLVLITGLLSLMIGCASTTYDLPPVTDSDTSDEPEPAQTYPAGEPAPSIDSEETDLQVPEPVLPSTNPAVTSCGHLLSGGNRYAQCRALRGCRLAAPTRQPAP